MRYKLIYNRLLMLELKNGKIYVDQIECNNPELLFFTLKDISEERTCVLIDS